MGAVLANGSKVISLQNSKTGEITEPYVDEQGLWIPILIQPSVTKDGAVESDEYEHRHVNVSYYQLIKKELILKLLEDKAE